jgi:predicted nucleic acid-binding protein
VLLLDTSAWTRLLMGAAPKEQAETIIGQMSEEQIATCVPFLLEAGFSARSAGDHLQIMDRLSRLPRVAIDSRVESSALGAQRELAAVGHHRLAPADVLIAACAHEAGAGVLHYDRDYDLIVEHTSLSFESVWLAPAGTL